ncbi:uncharacterized protein LOC132250946 [Alligator mississippiensis]|uniref:uncharacterized protein LOC132250946 n=1 Tax=Alligator mississippiensis TaxID=8496 RepID=UPI00287812E0|nr:uncharacterized protein LOC132250946 [Alligator mississippiensis]
MCNFFQVTKTTYGPCSIGKKKTLQSQDSSWLLKDNDAIHLCWKEHFKLFLNRESTIAEEILQAIPQCLVVYSLGSPPTNGELKWAIQQMKTNKACGPDGIPTEVYHVGGFQLTSPLYQLILHLWIPRDLKNATIVTIYKKGDKSDCRNYRGIFLLSIAGKILPHILLNHLRPITEEILPETHCGFQPSQGTTNMVFVARQIQEKCQKQNQELFVIFIDLTKALNSLNCEALWTTFQCLGCPLEFFTMLRLLHDDMTTTVLSERSETDAFHIWTRVKQGCVIAPTLFTIYLTIIIHLI